MATRERYRNCNGGTIVKSSIKVWLRKEEVHRLPFTVYRSTQDGVIEDG
jgi:hypothetical protein